MQTYALNILQGIVLNATKIFYRKRANPVRNVEYTNVVRMCFFLKGTTVRLYRLIWNNVSVFKKENRFM